MILILSTSLHPDSRSRILAQFAARCLADSTLEGKAVESKLIDLSQFELPFCDGASAYGNENVQQLAELVSSADAILIAGPVYNYDFGSAAKNLIELTGKAWTDKVVGIMCAAGSNISYMAPMQIANSLMLDFRCLVVPRFVFATGDKFEGPAIGDTEIENRIRELLNQMIHLGRVVKPPDDQP